MQDIPKPQLVENITEDELQFAKNFIDNNCKLPKPLYLEAIIAYNRIYQKQNYKTGKPLFSEVLVSQNVTNVIIK